MVGPSGMELRGKKGGREGGREDVPSGIGRDGIGGVLQVRELSQDGNEHVQGGREGGREDVPSGIGRDGIGGVVQVRELSQDGNEDIHICSFHQRALELARA